jgi:hypothetical protein
MLRQLSREEAERAYGLLVEKIPPDQQGDRWTYVMARLHANLGRDQGWPSESARRLAALLCRPKAEQLTASDVDLVLRELISLCNDEDVLLQTAAVCREIWSSL